MRNFIALSIVAVVLSACATKPATETIVLDTKPKVKATAPDEIPMREVHWKVYDRAALEAYLADAKTNNKDVLIFVLDEEGFKALNSNIADILAFVRQQKAGVKFYEQTYVDSGTSSSGVSSSSSSQ